MVGTLIKFDNVIGVIHNWWFNYNVGDCFEEIIAEVSWSDQDETTENFYDGGVPCEEYYFFYKERWFEVSKNYYKLKSLTEVMNENR